MSWLGSQLAWSNPIYYEVENIAGDVWQYTYTVDNQTALAIDQFTIFFDFDLYAFDLLGSTPNQFVDPATFSGPVDWDLLVAPPDGLFPGPSDDQPGFLDALALGMTIAPGDIVTAFTIEFHWLGSGAPGSQPFTLYGDDLLPDLADNFFTQPFPTIPMPEPGTLALLGAGFLWLRFGYRLKKLGTGHQKLGTGHRH